MGLEHGRGNPNEINTMTLELFCFFFCSDGAYYAPLPLFEIVGPN